MYSIYPDRENEKMMVTRGFLFEWFLGPLGGRVAPLVMREVGFCPDMGVRSGFHRAQLSLEGLQLQLSGSRRLLDANLFMGVGFWLSSKGLEPAQEHMLYDRVAFDFDSEEEPARAVGAALHFSSILSSRYQVDPIVFRSGFKGAHVVVPLSKPTDWEGYQLLWDHLYSLIPREHRSLVDPNMRQWNRLDRVPFTWNIKDGRRALAKVIHPEGLTPEGFDWGRLKGLAPSKVVVYRVEPPEPARPAIPPNSHSGRSGSYVKEVIAPCMVKLLEDCRRGVNLPHNARVALAAYLLNIGYPTDEVVNTFRSQPDFNERVTRYQVDYIATYGGGRPLLPYSCERMKRELGLCVADCGTRNPLGHNKARNRSIRVGAGPYGENRISSAPSVIAEFLRETGLTEFSYEDFRRWLESKRGPLSARGWHFWERRLREMAEEGFLGRRFLVNGRWVDYGPGRVERPPSKEVRFVKIHDFKSLGDGSR